MKHDSFVNIPIVGYGKNQSDIKIILLGKFLKFRDKIQNTG